MLVKTFTVTLLCCLALGSSAYDVEMEPLDAVLEKVLDGGETWGSVRQELEDLEVSRRRTMWDYKLGTRCWYDDQINCGKRNAHHRFVRAIESGKTELNGNLGRLTTRTPCRAELVNRCHAMGKILTFMFEEFIKWTKPKKPNPAYWKIRGLLVVTLPCIFDEMVRGCVRAADAFDKKETVLQALRVFGNVFTAPQLFSCIACKACKYLLPDKLCALNPAIAIGEALARKMEEVVNRHLQGRAFSRSLQAIQISVQVPDIDQVAEKVGGCFIKPTEGRGGPCHELFGLTLLEDLTGIISQWGKTLDQVTRNSSPAPAGAKLLDSDTCKGLPVLLDLIDKLLELFSKLVYCGECIATALGEEDWTDNALKAITTLNNIREIVTDVLCCSFTNCNCQHKFIQCATDGVIEKLLKAMDFALDVGLKVGVKAARVGDAIRCIGPEGQVRRGVVIAEGVGHALRGIRDQIFPARGWSEEEKERMRTVHPEHPNCFKEGPQLDRPVTDF